MNVSVYIYGQLSSGYTQYPADYTQNIFSNFQKHSQSTTQITIHRNGDLMYYGYLRKLEENRYIGLCAVINGKAITEISKLFGIFESTIESMVRNGYLIRFNDRGDIVSKVGKINEFDEDVYLIKEKLQNAFDMMENSSVILPAVSYGTSKDSVKSYSIHDSNDEIIRSSYTNGYTIIYKSKGYNTALIDSFSSILSNKNQEIQNLVKNNNELKSKVTSMKLKQRNMTWVSVLTIIAIILGCIVWTQVLFPNEVTKKNMGDYVYYGPMANGEPNGVGVAIYHDDDKDGRLYYYGNFSSGKRIDDDAIMFYKDGSYFKGSMNEDQWYKGLFFDVDKEHFIGEFKDNEPYYGDWYKHVKVQSINND